LAVESDWSTDSRYDQKESKDDPADPFPMAGKAVVTWAEKRVSDGHQSHEGAV
jgi:hypothetical protein